MAKFPEATADRIRLKESARCDVDKLGISCHQLLRYFLEITNNKIVLPWNPNAYLCLDEKYKVLAYVMQEEKWRIPICWKQGCQTFSQHTTTYCCRGHDLEESQPKENHDQTLLDALSSDKLDVVDYYMIGVHLARSPFSVPGGMLTFDNVFTGSYVYLPTEGSGAIVKCAIWKCRHKATLVSHTHAFCDEHLFMPVREKRYYARNNNEAIIIATMRLSVKLFGAMAGPWERETWEKMKEYLQRNSYHCVSSFFDLVLTCSGGNIFYKNEDHSIADLDSCVTKPICDFLGCFSLSNRKKPFCEFHSKVGILKRCTVIEMIRLIKLKPELQNSKELKLRYLATAWSDMEGKPAIEFENTKQQRKDFLSHLRKKGHHQFQDGLLLFPSNLTVRFFLPNGYRVCQLCNFSNCLKAGVIPAPDNIRCLDHMMLTTVTAAEDRMRCRILSAIRSELLVEGKEDDVWQVFLEKVWVNNKNGMQFQTSQENITITGKRENKSILIKFGKKWETARHACREKFCLRTSVNEKGAVIDSPYDIEKCVRHFMAELLAEKTDEPMFYDGNKFDIIKRCSANKEAFTESTLVKNVICAVLAGCFVETSSATSLTPSEISKLLLFLQFPVTYNGVLIWADDNDNVHYKIPDGVVKKICSIGCSKENLQNGCTVHTDMRPGRIRELITEKVKEILGIDEFTELNMEQLSDFRRVIQHSYIIRKYEHLDKTCNLTITKNDRIAVRLLTNGVIYPLCYNFGTLYNGKVCNGYSMLKDNRFCSFCKSPGYHLGLTREKMDGKWKFKVHYREKQRKDSGLPEFKMLFNLAKPLLYCSVASKDEVMRKKAALLMVANFERCQRNLNANVSMNAIFGDANLIFEDCVIIARKYGLEIKLVPATQEDRTRKPKYFKFSPNGTFIEGNFYHTIYEFKYKTDEEDWRYIGQRKYTPNFDLHFAQCHTMAKDETAAGKKMRELRQKNLLGKYEYLESKILAHCQLQENVAPEGVEIIFMISRVIMATTLPHFVVGNSQFYTTGNVVSPLPIDFLSDLNCILAQEINQIVELKRISDDYLLTTPTTSHT